MTKEEILDKEHWDFVTFHSMQSIHTKKFPVAYRHQALLAMQSYATQCTAPLEARIRELEEGLREWPGMSADYQKIEKWELRLKDLISGVASSSSDGWISVQERLPEVHEIALYSDRVLVFTSSGLMRVGFLMRGEWVQDQGGKSFKDSGYTVTHWQPLPKPPNTNTQQH